MSTNQGAPAPAGGDKPDYLDKGFDSATKKLPGKAGEYFRDPKNAQKNRAMGEKTTDAIRKYVEKLTGYVW
ncbi:MAG: hypothetical protein Q9201_005520 [Fulgogasparrea decipioides]